MQDWKQKGAEIVDGPTESRRQNLIDAVTDVASAVSKGLSEEGLSPHMAPSTCHGCGGSLDRGKAFS